MSSLLVPVASSLEYWNDPARMFGALVQSIGQLLSVLPSAFGSSAR
ncbi:hypothetical protein F5X71_07400 [Nocardia brasiliensis]|uniref:Uncharacterized protein n=1 Tax=Nocardia brasiliensis TaxID=37326 RepID=A0A6G9XMM5_NOCBR|nr:hypothetical protein [Nocardia brasiliensis]QIS02165.1 hypothetical protein F5X71_07400 [Nocardia brasiliensis]